MPEPPVARPPRRDDTAADAGSLEALGRLAPQPVPYVGLFLEPDLPPPSVDE